MGGRKDGPNEDKRRRPKPRRSKPISSPPIKGEHARQKRTEPLPHLDRLHERHIGLTESISRFYAEAASICFARHHNSPIDLEIIAGDHTTTRQVSWLAPDGRAHAAWANTDDATCNGAYSVALAAVEAEYSWVALERAETRTGADYYVGPHDTDDDTLDLEATYRLEIAGVDHGGRSNIAHRLTRKLNQARAGKSDLPALAAVIGFRERLVVVRAVEPVDE